MPKNEGTRLTELRTSNAAGAHQDSRTKRNRGRAAVERNALIDAWDEGYQCGNSSLRLPEGNPYREEENEHRY